MSNFEEYGAFNVSDEILKLRVLKPLYLNSNAIKILYRIRPSYRTYPYKRIVKWFRNPCMLSVLIWIALTKKKICCGYSFEVPRQVNWPRSTWPYCVDWAVNHKSNKEINKPVAPITAEAVWNRIKSSMLLIQTKNWKFELKKGKLLLSTCKHNLKIVDSQNNYDNWTSC